MQRTKARKWIVFIISDILALLFICMGGITKIAGANFQKDTFEHFNYPIWFMYVVGSIELILGVMVIFQKTRFWAACGMILVTIGVVFSIVRVGELNVGVLFSPPVIVMLVSVLLAALCKPSCS